MESNDSYELKTLSKNFNLFYEIFAFHEVNFW